MTPKVKYGLIAGGIGAVLNICVSAVIGCLGPLVAIVAGAAAGYLTVREAPPLTQNDGARTGAMAGAIAGALVLVGQLIGGLAVLLYFQTTGTPLMFGEIPQDGEAVAQVGYWVGGIGFGLCFGLVGVLLGALAGAGGGYFGTPARPAVIDQSPLTPDPGPEPTDLGGEDSGLRY